MTQPLTIEDLLQKLNPQQREAATHGDSPLLIVAGAGTGKTATLVHRVAWLIAQGVDPGRILLLTFTRRAAAEMLRRVENLLRHLQPPREPVRERPAELRRRARFHVGRLWGGTFHAVATRLLRRYGKAIGLPPGFTIHDRADAEDLMNVVRTELGLAKTDQRFPKKGTCMDIYSRCVNAREKLEQALVRHFPWCLEWGAELKRLFSGYVDRKEACGVLDYDDLLLYWHGLLEDPKAGPIVRGQFDCVLVDEYQDTNLLQAEIVYQLSPQGRGVTVVGDDAQSIYSFRAATVRNILDLPEHYPDTKIIRLEQNYRSTQPILEATNRVIGLAAERYAKNLWSDRQEGQRPVQVTCEDEVEQADFVIRKILEHREAGIALRRQAVLFRASHHSMLLEAELTARHIPFHKYGGLKFVETAHVKDLLAFLRLAENPRDEVAAARILPLMPGVGPVKARQLSRDACRGGRRFFRLGRLETAGRRGETLAGAGCALARPGGQQRGPAGASQSRPQVLRADPGNELRPRAAAAPRPGAARADCRPLAEPAADADGDGPGPAQLDAGFRRSARAGRRLPGPEHDPFGEGSGVGRRVRDPCRRRQYSFRHGDQGQRRRGGGAAVVLRRLDAGEELALRALPVAVLSFLSARRASDRYGMAQRTRFLPESVLKYFDRQITMGMSGQEDDAAGSLHLGLTSKAIRGKTKRFWG